MTPTARALLLFALCGGVCLVGVELLITAVALPRIVVDLADWTQLREASWVINAYLVAYIATMPLAGRAADRFGLPQLFGLSLLVFAIGSALSGAAQDLGQLVAARVVQGAGAGAVVPLATAGASHLYSGHARARAVGLVGALTFLGMAMGPFAGAAVLDLFELTGPLADAGTERGPLVDFLTPSWRWIFYLGVPLAAIVGLYAWAAGSGWTSPRGTGGIDLIGAILFTTALAAGLTAVTWGGTTAGPGGVVGSGPLAVVAAVATVLALIRFRFARDPFLELGAFRDRVFTSAVLVSLLTGYALATAIVGGAVFVDRVRYGGPDEQRVVLGALAGSMAIGALASGVALRWLGPVLLSVAGLAVGAGGMFLLSTARPASPLPGIVVGAVLFGVGFGVTVTPRSTAAVEALGRRAYGMASAGVTVARMIGMAVGLAVLTLLGSDRIEALSVVITDAAARDAVLPDALKGRPLNDGLVVDALERWAAGEASVILSGLFVAAAIIMLVTVLPALAMRRGRDTAARDAIGATGDVDDGPRAAAAL